MSDDASPEPKAEILPAQPPEESSRDLFPAVLQLEKQRIESYNRRTEVASQAVAASNESDRRQFEFQMRKLDSEDSASKRKDSLAKTVVIGVGVCLIIVVFLFLGMAFWGSPTQSEIALRILKVLAVGGGGYGIINGVVQLIRRLMKPPT